MNPRLARLQPYPFERLRALLSGVPLPAAAPIRLSIGEPQHATPALVTSALTGNLAGLSTYPATAGLDAVREAMAGWFVRRFKIPHLDAATQVLPVSGTREALFAIAQAVVDTSKASPVVVSPNPFYQIYEGAALLAGAEPVFLNQTSDTDFDLELESLTAEQWNRTQLVYVCSPGNPTGHVLDLNGWRTLFEYSDRYGFVIASDECYSEIYPDEDAPPLGALQAAHALGRGDFRNLVVFTSLSKRSNAPGLRSGGIAGDAALLKPFLLYRTYHGCAMSLPVQHASIAAWGDESHVRDNRAQYRAKFDAVVPMLEGALDVRRPDASFYLWAGVPGGDDEAFTRELFARTHVTVLPGRYLARDAHGNNPGAGYVRIALVPGIEDCVEAVRRVVEFCVEFCR
ncbi:MAG TPA: succinyldiaminopimelate transaminase [Vicinamibacterales bacterium]|jgi:N-succinyldiaminopimelate aminotransferase|nr:succinyldiaminopimelate transaminase [Vicinamibacterales bacterium]